MHRTTLVSAAAAVVLIAVPTLGNVRGFAQAATPTPAYTCENVRSAGMPGTPGAMPHDMAGTMMDGTPMAGMDHSMMELDQMYIDMMIPHHESIVAMAQAARPRLTDPRLREIADAIVAAQTAEIEELRGYRDQVYGDRNPMPMDAGMMDAMAEMMPTMSGSMADMAFQMDAAAQVAAICAAADPDLAFIDLTIPHHRMAIESSAPVAAGATHQEVRDFARRVIEDQQREIDELEAIRIDLTGEGTPASS
jgi:uncharacterized protein (DUF305 family)